MHLVRRSRVLHAPAERVGETLDDFGGVQAYHPHMGSSRLLTDTETGLGACRDCVFTDGSRIDETIVDYTSREGYTVAFTDTGRIRSSRTQSISTSNQSTSDTRE